MHDESLRDTAASDSNPSAAAEPGSFSVELSSAESEARRH